MIKKIKLISLSTQRFHSDVTHIELSKNASKKFKKSPHKKGLHTDRQLWSQRVNVHL